MTFPSEVIYELANTLRRGYNNQLFQDTVGTTADFLRNHLLGNDPASIPQETVFSIERTAKVLPVDYAFAAQEGNKFNFSMGMRRSAIDVKPNAAGDQIFMFNPYPAAHGNWFVVVEQGVNQYEVVAARDETFFELGQISRRQEIVLDLRQGSIGLSGSSVYFILSSWAHVGYVLTNASATFHATVVEYRTPEGGDHDEEYGEETVPGTEVAVCESYDDLKSVFVKRDIFESLNLDFPGDEKEISVADLVEALCQKDQANEISDEEAELLKLQQLVGKVIDVQGIVEVISSLPPKKRTQKYIRELILENLGQKAK